MAAAAQAGKVDMLQYLLERWGEQGISVSEEEVDACVDASCCTYSTRCLVMIDSVFDHIACNHVGTCLSTHNSASLAYCLWKLRDQDDGTGEGVHGDTLRGHLGTGITEHALASSSSMCMYILHKCIEPCTTRTQLLRQHPTETYWACYTSG